MSEETRRAVRPATLLTQNSQLRALGIYNWTLPAWADRFEDDGSSFNTCPSAGVCAKLCYARVNAYRFPIVRRRHQQNLRYVLDDLPGWEKAMMDELSRKKFRGKWIRIHDAGDFFSDDYLSAWLRIMTACPDSIFYAYTKEVPRFRRLVEPEYPWNFKWVYSLGGKYDWMLDPAYDRVADVFPTEEAIAELGWFSQLADDRLAVIGPAPVGMASNRIPQLQKLQGPFRFGELQKAHDERERERRERRTTTPPPEAATG